MPLHRRAVAEAIAREAGALVRRRFADLGSVGVSMKGHQDVLTEADGETEALIRARLTRAFPDDGVLGEEGGGEITNSVWIVDPIDGTSNFARGIGHFCVSVAYVRDGEPLVGVIYDPTRDELFSAHAGEGATLDGRPIRVSSATELRNASVECGWSMRLPIADYLALCARVAQRGAGLYRMGSGALGMAYVAAGRLDAYCELHINAWDVLAGLVLVREAGGTVNDFVAGGRGLRLGNPILGAAPGVAAAMGEAAGIRL